MAFKIWSTFLAIIFLPKIATPEGKLLAVSLRLGKKACEGYETSLSGVKTTYEESDKAKSWDSANRQCAWALNSDSWTSPSGIKGIWTFACSASSSHVSGGGKRKSGTEDRGNFEPCASVEPALNSTPFANIQLGDNCDGGKYQPSTYLNNYYKCERSKAGGTTWTENTCGKKLFWNPRKEKCDNFQALTLDVQQKYCERGCVGNCGHESEKKYPKSGNKKPWEGGPVENCTVCEGAKRNVSSYCRNYETCSDGAKWDEDWDEFVCPKRTFWHQTAPCSGACKKWEDLPLSLQIYYSNSSCCPTPDKTTPPPSTPTRTSTTTPISTRTTTPTLTRTTTRSTSTTPPPGDCNCKLRGYCKWFQTCIGGIWSLPNNCTHDLYWQPNNLTGGTCTHFESLSEDIQVKYKKDPTCYGCEWFQEAADVCSPKYTFRDENGTTHKLSCPEAPSGQRPLYWNLEIRACDECWRCVDGIGRHCKC